MCFVSRSIATIVFAAIPFIAFSTPADAGIGDLLVAPTRIVLDGRKGAEIVLNNIGEEPATYRISVEFRRMVQDGTLQDVPEPTAADKTFAGVMAITGDPLPYGVAPNRREIEAVIQYSVEQGILAKPFAIEDVFAAGTLDLAG